MLTIVVLPKAVPLTVVVGAILLAESWRNEYIGADIALWLAVAIVCYELFQLGIDVLSGELRVGETVELRVAQKFIRFVIGAVLVENEFCVRGLIFGTITGSVVSFPWGMYRPSAPSRSPSFLSRIVGC